MLAGRHSLGSLGPLSDGDDYRSKEWKWPNPAEDENRHRVPETRDCALIEWREMGSKGDTGESQDGN
jgi:hypothetical protein